MTFKKFILALVSVDGNPSSKRFLAFFFSVVLTIAVFTGFEVSILIMLSALITALLGITGVEKFAKNFKNNQDIG